MNDGTIKVSDLLYGAKAAFFTFLFMMIFVLLWLVSGLTVKIGELEHTLACMERPCVVTGPGHGDPAHEIPPR